MNTPIKKTRVNRKKDFNQVAYAVEQVAIGAKPEPKTKAGKKSVKN